MGAAKFPEEINERSDESGSLEWDRAPATPCVPERPSPRMIACPLCPERFLEEKVLDDHVARSHGKQHVYLKVDGHIVRDIYWLKQPLKECRLVLLQVPSLDVTVQANDKENHLTIHETTSLMEYLPEKQARVVICIRRYGLPTRTFTIYSGRQPKFQTRRMDVALVGLMDRITQRPHENLVDFRDKWRRKRLNELESRYLDGVVEYCHGWQLERDDRGTLARDRLETAMNLLMPFQTDLALDLLCALALRMNCFAGQWGCEEDSPFRLAERFFCRNPSTREEKEGETRKTNIPLDPNTGLVLEALSAYYSKDDSRVFDTLNKARMSHRARDRNDEDKLNLIEARTKARSGDRRGAANIFELFRGHPLFGAKAQSLLTLLD